jgi:hypothetical protein
MLWKLADSFPELPAQYTSCPISKTLGGAAALCLVGEPPRLCGGWSTPDRSRLGRAPAAWPAI